MTNPTQPKSNPNLPLGYDQDQPLDPLVDPTVEPVGDPLSWDLHQLKFNFSDYYSPRMLRIRDKAARLIPFTLNPVQRQVDQLLNKHIKRHRTFMYILKARQTGISTWAEGRLFHLTHMFKNMRNVIIANDSDGSENVYNMSRMFHDNLPTPWRPESKYSSKKQLVFSNPTKEGRLTSPGLRSSIDVFTAGRGTSGRSFNFNCMHLSEFAFFPTGESLLASLVPALPTNPGHFIIMETTANGTGNFAYEEWKRYKKMHAKYGDDSEFLPVFIAWYHDPSYIKPFLSDKYKKDFLETMSSDDKKLMKGYKLHPEQMWWRQNQIDAMGGNVELFVQEYPSNDEEAFLSSGRPVFNLNQIRLALAGCSEPKFQGEITPQGDLNTLHNGRLRIWHFPRAGRSYTLGVDPIGEGRANNPNPKGDKAIIQVIDDETLEQCAEWSGQLEPLAMAPIVRALGMAYSTNPDVPALIVPEINSGGSLVHDLEKDYWNIYRYETFDQAGIKLTGRLGWRTDVRTKPMLVDFSTFVFHNQYCKIHSIDLLSEMRTFVYNPTDMASSGAETRALHDDRVMAWMIAVFVAGKNKPSFHSHLYQKSNVEDSKVIPLEKRLSDRIDSATIDIDNYTGPRPSRFRKASSWMAY